MSASCEDRLTLPSGPQESSSGGPICTSLNILHAGNRWFLVTWSTRKGSYPHKDSRGVWSSRAWWLGLWSECAITYIVSLSCPSASASPLVQYYVDQNSLDGRYDYWIRTFVWDGSGVRYGQVLRWWHVSLLLATKHRFKGWNSDWSKVDIRYMAWKLNIADVCPSSESAPCLCTQLTVRTKDQWRIVWLVPLSLVFTFCLLRPRSRFDEIACCEILELDIPHEDHIKCIIWIRLVLDPDQPIEDYDDVSLVLIWFGCHWREVW